jgi:hypothetical protein
MQELRAGEAYGKLWTPSDRVKLTWIRHADGHETIWVDGADVTIVDGTTVRK